jgi:hypothetical protein
MNPSGSSAYAICLLSGQVTFLSTNIATGKLTTQLIVSEHRKLFSLGTSVLLTHDAQGKEPAEFVYSVMKIEYY